LEVSTYYGVGGERKIQELKEGNPKGLIKHLTSRLLDYYPGDMSMLEKEMRGDFAGGRWGLRMVGERRGEALVTGEGKNYSEDPLLATFGRESPLALDERTRRHRRDPQPPMTL